jgi:hypothetical protein
MYDQLLCRQSFVILKCKADKVSAQGKFRVRESENVEDNCAAENADKISRHRQTDRQNIVSFHGERAA